jgi:hypothetical protein
MKKSHIHQLFFCFLSLLLFSCEKIILVDNISDKEVMLVTPQDNAQFYAAGVSFTWESLENAEKYRLQIAKPNFANPAQIVLDTLISKTTYTKQLTIGNYEWRVKATNSSYGTAYKSRVFAVVSNDDFQSNTVMLVSPVNNLITNTALQNLTWQSILGATNYQVQVFDASNTVVKDQIVTSTNFSYTFPQGNYQWRVRASNGTNQTFYSSHAILVDTTNPNVPTLTDPGNTSVAPSTNVTFKWTRTAISGSAETDKIFIYTNSTLTNLQLSSETTSPFTTTLTTGTYYWVVKSYDAAGNTSNQSAVFNFSVN